MIKEIMEKTELEKVKVDRYEGKYKEIITGTVSFEKVEGPTTLKQKNGDIILGANYGKYINNLFNMGSDPREFQKDLLESETEIGIERIRVLILEHCVDVRVSCKLSDSGNASNNGLRAILHNLKYGSGVYYLDRNKRPKERKYTLDDFNEIEKDEKKIGTWAKKRGVRIKLYSKATEKGFIDLIEGDLVRFEVVYTDRKASSKNKIDDVRETLEIIKSFVNEYDQLKGKRITPSTKALHEIVQGLKRCVEKYL